jgi:2-polyprenyl-6-methoxyphenol hydroxylase-like FAD-dependent oxidoreductase
LCPFYNHGMDNMVCIRGAGVVGQVLALLLARARIRVNLIAHPSGSVAKDVRSYALNAASRQLLTDLRVWPDNASPVNSMRIWADGERAIDFGQPEQALAWIVDAQSLLDQLASAIRYAPEIEVSERDPTGNPALTVICEGRSSASRDERNAHFQRFAYEQSAVAAHVTCELPHHNTAFQWMETGRICALLPRGVSQAGNSAALVWSVPHEQALALESMAAAEFEHSLEQSTQSLLGGVRLCSERVRWPLMIAQADHWCGQASTGAWVLAGDAAHAMHPLAGQGLNLGLGDAKALASGLAGKPYFRALGDMRLLRSYERERKAEAAMLLLATDGLQRVFSHPDGRLQAIRAWGMKGVDQFLPLKSWLMQRASGL